METVTHFEGFDNITKVQILMENGCSPSHYYVVREATDFRSQSVRCIGYIGMQQIPLADCHRKFTWLLSVPDPFFDVSADGLLTRHSQSPTLFFLRWFPFYPLFKNPFFLYSYNMIKPFKPPLLYDPLYCFHFRSFYHFFISHLLFF